MGRQWQILEMIVHANHYTGVWDKHHMRNGSFGQGRSHAAPDPPFALGLHIRHLTRLTPMNMYNAKIRSSIFIGPANVYWGKLDKTPLVA